MKKIFTILLVTLIAFNGYSQQSSLEKRIKAEKIKHYVLFKYLPNSKAIQYEIDPSKQNKSKQHLINDINPLEFVANHNKVNVCMAFVNPLAYNISYKIENTEDDIYKNIKTYTENLTKFLTATSGSKVEIELNEIALAKNKIIDNIVSNNFIDSITLLNKLNKDNVYSLVGLSPIVYSWYLHLNQLYITKDKKTKSIVKDIVYYKSISELLFSIESSFYENLNPQKKLVNEIINKYNKIKTINDYSNFLKECTEFRQLVKKELLNNETTNTKLNDLLKLSNKEMKFDELNETEKVFRLYTSNVVQQYGSEVKKELDKQKVLFEGYITILNELEILRENYDEERDSYKLTQIDVQTGVTSKFTLSIEPKEKPNNNKITSVSANISDYSMLIPEISAGLNFTSIESSTFGLSNDSSGFTVQRNGISSSNISTLMMLNFLPVMGKSVAYPILQVGAGLTTNLNNFVPVFGIGTGIRMFHPFDMSFSVGYLWHWDQALKSLKEGDKVDNTAALKNDISYKFNPEGSLYIGIHYNFGK